ncbi:MAG: PAS domain S-box protein [Methanoregula sp.]|jgi:PAS domain S-box-containing protein|uniref:PAS domain S-box protein n=1 Tax=Methanoregula sp. TaxID=2052170 RepID=UPI0025ECC244|nr:PAS domain S-box protein [Methanoregula sp.]MCK9630878.1 PAS domain S-box protein [Methanoregula sp.]
MYSLLYVDDDEAMLGVNKIFLEKTGEYSVDIVTSGHEALDRIASADYDLILSDYQMPVMDGIELLKEVRMRHGNLPFIIFTGKGREEVVMEALNNGVDYYVQKGPDIKGMLAELKHKINRAIERNQTGDELKKSRQQLTDIINFLPDATFVIDTSGRVIAWNHAIETMTGVRKEDMLGKGDYEYALPFLGGRRPLIIDTVLQEPPALETPGPGFRLYTNKISQDLFVPALNGGRGAYLSIHAGPLCDPDGMVEGAIETIRDITETHQIKHDLDLSRDANLGFANILPVGVYEMDLNYILTFANDKAFEIFGLTREDFQNSICIIDYIVPEDRRRASADIQNVAMQGATQGQEYLLQKKDGSTFPAHIYGAPVMDPVTKTPVGLRGVIIDLTQRKLEAQALHESEERLKLALRSEDIGIWDVDMRTMTVRDIHEWTATTMGYEFVADAVTMDMCQSHLHSADLPKVYFAFHQHLNGKTPYFKSEFRLRHNDGSWKWMAARGMIIERDENDKPIRITGTISVITRPE